MVFLRSCPIHWGRGTLAQWLERQGRDELNHVAARAISKADGDARQHPLMTHPDDSNGPWDDQVGERISTITKWYRPKPQLKIAGLVEVYMVQGKPG